MSAFQRYQAEFVAYIRDPKSHPRPNGTARRGMAVYAEIVFNHMDDTLSACFPVCRKVLGVRRWKKLVRAFLAQHRCTTPFFHQIPEEWLRWLETAPAAARDLPPFLMSLAHYEWVELAVATSDATPAAHDPQGDWLEGRPVLAPALMLLRYAWPVHRISPRFQPKVPLSQPVHLLVFRDRRDAVRFMELAPASARLVGLLQEGRLTGRQALERVMEEMCLSHPEQMFQAGRQLLQMLKAQGVLWGVSKV